MLKSFNKKYDDNTNQDRKNDCRNSQVKGIRAGVGLVIRKMHVFPVIWMKTEKNLNEIIDISIDLTIKFKNLIPSGDIRTCILFIVGICLSYNPADVFK